jgi:hypothetical protein
MALVRTVKPGRSEHDKLHLTDTGNTTGKTLGVTIAA